MKCRSAQCLNHSATAHSTVVVRHAVTPCPDPAAMLGLSLAACIVHPSSALTVQLHCARRQPFTAGLPVPSPSVHRLSAMQLPTQQPLNITACYPSLYHRGTITPSHHPSPPHPNAHTAQPTAQPTTRPLCRISRCSSMLLQTAPCQPAHSLRTRAQGRCP